MVLRILESHSALNSLIIQNLSTDVNGKTKEFHGMWSSEFN